MMKRQNLILVIVGVLLLVGLFYFVREQQTTSSLNPAAPQITQEPSPSPLNVFELTIKDKKLATGPEVISVKKGESVTIKITSDTGEEFHLHGYDKSVDLEANQVATLQLIADKEGRFEYELEDAGTEIGALEVTP